MQSFAESVDPFLIWMYRLSGFTFIDFLIGTFVLAFIAVAVGEITISFAFLLALRRIEETTQEVLRYQNMSIEALQAGNREAYNAANKLANDAFGKSFFLQIGLSAARIWPIFFAFAWMDYRFGDVHFPFAWTDITVRFPCFFIPLYVACYLIFKRVKRHISYFQRIQAILENSARTSKKMKSFSDLFPDGNAVRKES